MPGHVFHPGHEELHGITVVLNDPAGRTFVGRYHELGPRGVVLHDVAIHDPATTDLDRAEWLIRQRRFGVQVTQRLAVVPIADSQPIQRLADHG